jgi:hypothetical protein
MMKANGATDVVDSASARHLLEDAGYLIPGELFLMENVALVLFQAARSMTKPHKATRDIIRALGYAVGEISTSTLAETIATSVLEKLRVPITLLAEATTAATELNSNLSSLSQPLVDQPGTLTYARVASQAIPPHHAEEVTRGAMLERRMIVGGKDEKELAKLTEKELVAKANMALALMSSQDCGAPEGTVFLGAEVLRSQAIAYHLNSTEAAIWIQQPEVWKNFMNHFGSTSAAHSTLLHCVAEYVPVTFDTTSLVVIQKVERDSNLKPCTLQFAKFIKSKERRYDGQRVAHAIFGFLTRDAENFAMTNGLYVEGKRVNLQKLLPEPRRCLKCQIVGPPILRMTALAHMTPALAAPNTITLTNVKSRTGSSSVAAIVEGSGRRTQDMEQGTEPAQCSRGKWRSYGQGPLGLGTDTSLQQTQFRGSELTAILDTRTGMTLPGSERTGKMEVVGQQNGRVEVA